MDWLQECFIELSLPNYPASVSYSQRFKGYNANMRVTKNTYVFSLSYLWKDVDVSIRKGVIQQLLIRFHKLQLTTPSTQLYTFFLQNLSEYAPRTASDSLLSARFAVLNEQYFSGLLSQPNLVWGSYSLTKLGHYEYASDTVSISTALKEAGPLLDYVLYHELLHKKHKFTCTSSGRTRHHTRAFREDEKKFLLPRAEEQLSAYIQRLREQKRSSWWKW